MNTDYIHKIVKANITDVCGYTALNEKMAGSFHIAISAQNEAKMHMDFVSSGSFELLPVK